MDNYSMKPPTDYETLYKAYEQLLEDYLSAGGCLAIIVSWLRGEKGSMSDLTTQDIYDMIAKEVGYKAEVITTELVSKAVQE